MKIKYTRNIVFLMILILIFSNSLIVIAEGEGELDNNLTIHMDEDGLIKLKTTDDEANKAWSTLIERYKVFITGIAGVGAVTMVVLFITYFLRLGVVGGYGADRRRIIVGLFVTGISSAGLGAISLITYIFYFALK